MTATPWLLAGLSLLILGMLIGLVWAKCISAVEEVLDYRTANAGALDSDVRRIQAQVPDAPPRTHKRDGPANTRPLTNGTTQVRAQAVNAALLDVARGTTTANPYREGSTAHATWAQHYARLISDQKLLHQV